MFGEREKFIKVMNNWF